MEPRLFRDCRQPALGAGGSADSALFLRYNGDYFDEQGRPLPAPVEPCGQWGIGNYRIIDDLVSRALGIPLAPVE